MVTTPNRLSPFLAKEIKNLGFPVLEELDAGVFTAGTLTDAITLNLGLSVAHRVLFELASFKAVIPTHVYEHVYRIPWEMYFPKDGYIGVSSSVRNRNIKDTMYPNLLVKDAIVDKIKFRTGQRPDSGPDTTKNAVFLYWHNNDASVFLDTTGDALSRRGYRKNPWKAPLQETLAAALVHASGWDGTSPFVNPMCGSGTLAIEAAFMAQKKSPVLVRDEFAFQHILGYEPDMLTIVRNKLKAEVNKQPNCRIIATDIAEGAVEVARKNAKTAGVEHLIEFQVCDFTETFVPEEKGVIMLNPEYGERLGKDKDLEQVYEDIGKFLKHKAYGYKAFVFSGNHELLEHINLKKLQEKKFYNAAIECVLAEYQP